MKECRVEPVCSPCFVQSFNCLSGCVFFLLQRTQSLYKGTPCKNKKQYLIFAQNSKFCGAGKDLLYLQRNIGSVLI